MKGGRKTLFVTIIIVVLAAILGLVFFTLFKKKDTSALAESMNEYATTGYLSTKSNSDYDTIKEYLDKVYNKVTNVDSKREAENIKNAYDGYRNVAAFFNRETQFMEYTKFYKDNRKDVEDLFKSAQKHINNLKKTIKKNNTITSGDSFWEERAWQEVKGEMKKFISDTIDAFNLYAKIYQKSVKSNLLNNDFSDIVFMGLKNLSKDFKTSTTKLNSGTILRNFEVKYFTTLGENKILEYQYETNQTIINKVNDLKAKGVDSDYYADFILSKNLDGSGS